MDVFDALRELKKGRRVICYGGISDKETLVYSDDSIYPVGQTSGWTVDAFIESCKHSHFDSVKNYPKVGDIIGEHGDEYMIVTVCPSQDRIVIIRSDGGVDSMTSEMFDRLGLKVKEKK